MSMAGTRAAAATIRSRSWSETTPGGSTAKDGPASAATISERRSSSRASTVAEATHAICSSVTLPGAASARRGRDGEFCFGTQRRRANHSGGGAPGWCCCGAGHGRGRGGRWFDHLRLGGFHVGWLRLCVATARGDYKHCNSYYSEENVLHMGIIETGSSAGMRPPRMVTSTLSMVPYHIVPTGDGDHLLTLAGLWVGRAALCTIRVSTDMLCVPHRSQ